jgi:tetratricopeptide (TPR) repeat protein
MPLKVLISHAHSERSLAEAWKTLLETVSLGAVEPWYSSDTQPDGGMQIGEEWREQLRQRIGESDFVIALLSPQTRDRPWILWECGVANGAAQERGGNRTGAIIPITHSMTAGDLANPLSSFQVYKGDERASVQEICERLVAQAGLKPKPELWGSPLEQYLAAIAAHRPRRARRAEDMALWRARIESLLESGRIGEVPALRQAMYATFGEPFQPQDPLLHDILSRAMLDCKRYRETIEEVDHALELVEFDVHLLHRRALAATHLNELDTALNTLKKLSDVDQSLASNPEIAGLEGRIYRERYATSNNEADIRAARAAYQRAMDANPSDYYCAVNAGALALAAKDAAGAEKAFERALKAAQEAQAGEPATYWADFSVGECFLGKGDVEHALEEYARGVKRKPAPSPRDRESALNGVIRMARLRNLGNEVITPFRNVLG